MKKAYHNQVTMLTNEISKKKIDQIERKTLTKLNFIQKTNVNSNKILKFTYINDLNTEKLQIKKNAVHKARIRRHFRRHDLCDIQSFV